MDPWLVIAIIVLVLFWVFWANGRPRIKSLKNKHVVITGGSDGIGLHMASLALLEHAFVTIISRTPHKLQKAVEELIKETKCSPDRVAYQAADIGNYTQISGAIEAAQAWKPIDVLICNAGYVKCEHIENQSVEDLDRTVGTNLIGTLYTIRAAIPFFKNKTANPSSPRPPKSILIVSSTSSMFFLYGNPIYTATKYAQRGLAEALRIELMPYNVSVGISCPHFTDTPMLQHTLDEIRPELLTWIKLFNLYNPKLVEDPRNAAKYTLMAVKKGSFITSALFPGLFISTLSRGVYPADSLSRALLELILYLPFRLLSFLIAIVTIIHNTILIHLFSKEKLA